MFKRSFVLLGEWRSNILSCVDKSGSMGLSKGIGSHGLEYHPDFL